jgi:hypothetical protein
MGAMAGGQVQIEVALLAQQQRASRRAVASKLRSYGTSAAVDTRPLGCRAAVLVVLTQLVHAHGGGCSDDRQSR